MGMPNMNMPNMGMPNMGMPNMNVPNMNMPNANIPSPDEFDIPYPEEEISEELRRRLSDTREGQFQTQNPSQSNWQRIDRELEMVPEGYNDDVYDNIYENILKKYDD